MPIKNFESICTLDAMSLLINIRNYYGDKPLEFCYLLGRESRTCSVDAILGQLNHLAGKEKIIIEMLEKFKDLPNTVYPPIESKHIIPYAEEVVKLAENMNKAYNLLKDLSGLDLQKATNYLFFEGNLVLEHVDNIIMLEDRFAEIAFYIEKTHVDKEIDLYYSRSPLLYPDNFLLLLKNKEKVQRLNDLLEKKGYGTLFSKDFFKMADNIVEVAGKYDVILENIKNVKTENENMKPDPYHVIREYCKER